MPAKFVHRGQEGIVPGELCVGDYCFGFGSESIEAAQTGRRSKNKKPKKKYVIVAEHAAWVDCIFRWFVVDRRSLRWITKELNRLEAPKGHRSSKDKWCHQQLRGLLSNRKYIGEWSWGRMKNERDPLTGTVQQVERPVNESDKWTRSLPDLRIIDDDLFEQAQLLLAENKVAVDDARRQNGKAGKKHGQLV